MVYSRRPLNDSDDNEILALRRERAAQEDINDKVQTADELNEFRKAVSYQFHHSRKTAVIDEAPAQYFQGFKPTPPDGPPTQHPSTQSL